MAYLELNKQIRLCFDLLFNALSTIKDKSITVYAYGGFVRDIYLGYLPNDIDLGVDIKDKLEFYNAIKILSNEYLSKYKIPFRVGEFSNNGFSIGFVNHKLLDIHFISKNQFLKSFFKTTDFTINSLIIQLYPIKSTNDPLRFLEQLLNPKSAKHFIIKNSKKLMPHKLWALAIHDLNHKILRVNPFLDFKLNDRLAARFAKFVERGLEFDPETKSFIESGFKIDPNTLKIALKQSLLLKISLENPNKNLAKELMKDKNIDDLLDIVTQYNTQRINYDLFKILKGNAAWAKINSDERFYYVIKFVETQTRYFSHLFHREINLEILKYLNTKGLKASERAIMRFIALTFPFESIGLDPIVLFNSTYKNYFLEKSIMLPKDTRKLVSVLFFYFLVSLHYFIIYKHQVKSISILEAQELIYEKITEFYNLIRINVKTDFREILHILNRYKKLIIRMYINILYALWESQHNKINFISSSSVFNEYRKFILYGLFYFTNVRSHLENMILGIAKKFKISLNSEKIQIVEQQILNKLNNIKCQDEKKLKKIFSDLIKDEVMRYSIMKKI